MNFVNNWSRPIVLAAGAETLSGVTGLADGDYTLTLTDSATAPTRWEIVLATLVSGSATLQRAQEGTTDQEWPAGSIAYCSITAGVVLEIFETLSLYAGQIADLESRVSALEPEPEAPLFSGMQVVKTSGVFADSSLDQIVLSFEYSPVKVLEAADFVAGDGIGEISNSSLQLLDGQTYARFTLAEGVTLPPHDEIRVTHYGLADAVISLVNQFGEPYNGQPTSFENGGISFNVTP